MNRRKAALVGALGGFGHVGLWGRASLIRSIQIGTIDLNSQTSQTATIASVNTANSVLVMMGAQGLEQNNGSISAFRLTLTNATTVTATHNTASTNSLVARFAVVEFEPGVLKSVQYGTVSISASTSGTATITEVNTAKTILLWLGKSTTSTIVGFSALFSDVTLTNGTTVTATTGNSETSVTSFVAVELF